MSIQPTVLRILSITSLLPALMQAAEIRGTVQDRTGASLPSAVIVVRNLDLNREHTTKTDGQGTYSLPALAAGRYTIRFSAPGFEDKQTKELILAEDTSLALSETLDTKGVQTSVEVAMGAEMVQITRSAQTKLITLKEIASLPTASHNITHLIVAEAGVSAPLPDRTGRGMNIATAPGTQAEDATQTLNPSVNGARPSNNALQLNGLNITNMMNGAGGLGNNMTLPLDALQEVEMQTALYSSSTGRNGGGNIQLITHGVISKCMTSASSCRMTTAFIRASRST